MTDTQVAPVEDHVGLAHLSATICAELAAGLSDAAGCREKYEISEAQWEKLKNSPTFRSMLKEAMQEWKGDLNAAKRITKKAEILLEDALPVLREIAHDRESPRQQRIDSVKEMKSIARPNNGKEAAAGGQGAQINIIIDTGGEQETKTVTIDAQALPPVEEAA